MNQRDLPQQDRNAFRALERHRALSLHLPIGSSVRALSGKVWLTQEGLIEDVILLPGHRFEVTRKGLIVMNAIAESASVFIGSPNETGASLLSVTPAAFSSIHAEARRLRRLEIARLVHLVPKLFTNALRRSPPPGSSTYCARDRQW